MAQADDSKNTKSENENSAGQGIRQNLLRATPKNISGSIVNIIPKEVAKKYGMMAFERAEDVLKIAMLIRKMWKRSTRSILWRKKKKQK